MKVLVINAGSSSLKYQIIDMQNEEVLAKGICERITFPGSVLTQKTADGRKSVIKEDMPTHKEALELVLKALVDPKNGAIKDIKEISAVGHRVLHSGEDFKSSVLVTDEVIEICKKNIDLGPLHMPGNIGCVESCREVLGKDVPMALVFDTTFHSTMPPKAYLYGIPYEDYEAFKVRKYGFHGTSHKYISGEIQKWLGTDKFKAIICHLGNGSSLSAVKDGVCVDTTMGFTPLEGVMMGTRSGDIDPAAVEFLANKKGMTLSETVQYLNKKSGMLGISGFSSDCRDLTSAAEEGNERAKLALDMTAYRIKNTSEHSLRFLAARTRSFSPEASANTALLSGAKCSKVWNIWVLKPISTKTKILTTKTCPLFPNLAPKSRLQSFRPTRNWLLLAKQSF